MTDADYRELLPTIPIFPGVYQFIGSTGEILYVGKAKNLKNRLSSYFGIRQDMRKKTETMVRSASTLRFTIVESEHDALLLESSLIRKHQPKYNIALKSGDGYPYLKITTDRFPRIEVARRVVKDGAEYFGPYPSKNKVYDLYRLIRDIFQLRNCSLSLTEMAITNGKFQKCLEYDIKKCQAPCIGYQSDKAYLQMVSQVRTLLKGNFGAVSRELKARMVLHAEKMEFERAQELKLQLQLFEDYQGKSTVVNPKVTDVDVFSIKTDENYAFVNFMRVINGAIIHTLTLDMLKNLNQEETEILSLAILDIHEKFGQETQELILPYSIDLPNQTLKQTVPLIGDKKKLLELSEKNANYAQLQRKKQELLKVNKQSSSERILLTTKQDLRLDSLPIHIECFDNSNFQGSFPVSSCVVFRNAKPSKRDYRHYNVKTVEGINDFATMEEVVYRRYKRLIAEGLSLPQLIIIDGGKGQLSSAVKSLEILGILDKVKVIGIAKQLEEIFFPNDPHPLHINKKSESLKLIQQLRNEAHRFAISFHRDQRSKALTATTLTEIPHIGQKTADKLLQHFGSVQTIKESNIDTLAKVVGLKIAKLIFDYYQVTK